MVKQITEEQIEEIKNLINTHNTIKAKIILDKLEEFEDKLRDELEKEIRSKGKTNVVFIDRLNQILDETKLNNKEVLKMGDEEDKESEEETEEKDEEKTDSEEESEEKEETSEDKEDSE